MLCRHATSFRISVNNTIALDVSHVVDSVVNGGSEGQGQKQVLDASKSYQVYSYSAIPILNRRDVSNFVHHLKKELNCWDNFLETQAFTFEN